MAYQLPELAGRDLSVALTAELDAALGAHLHKPHRQEDLAFAYWRPSRGTTRLTAVVSNVVWPSADERILSGNASFLPHYLDRVLRDLPDGNGIAFLHGHPGPGWQDMSGDDVFAERERLAGAVAGRTGLPLVGLTRATDGAWSGRFWARTAPRTYERLWARTVRVVGRSVRTTFHPSDLAPRATVAQVETINVWGQLAQDDLARARVGVIGLGSVGSLVGEALSRMGLRRLTYVDFDRLEERNLDRTHGATGADVAVRLLKVQVAARATSLSHTAPDLELEIVPLSILTPPGPAAALDCDGLVCCVDRPLPRCTLAAQRLSVQHERCRPRGLAARRHPRWHATNRRRRPADVPRVPGCDGGSARRMHLGL
jgi:molybdopterin-synthase adenylyltransferase